VLMGNGGVYKCRLYSDFVCVIISNRNFTEFSTTANLVLARMIE